MEITDDNFFTNDTAWPPFHYAAKGVYYLLGTFLTVVGVTGIVGNTLVIIVFTRFKRLKGPFSILILNLALGDLLTSVLHIMVVISSFKGKWAFGHSGCVLYAFGVGFSGTMSIFTLAAISVERYLVITARPMSSWKMTAAGAKRLCVTSWLYCSCLTLPPIFGWSKYTVEGLLTSCSWDYMTRTLDNRLFYLYLVGFGFFFPMGIILFCYTFIISAVLSHAREMSSVSMTLGGVLSRYRVTVDARSSAFKTAETILVLIIFFFLSWTPYAIVTLIGHFGPEDVLTPYVCAIPAFCAKASVICNPIIYGWTHPHFKTSVKLFFSTWRNAPVECFDPHNTQRSQSIQSNHELHYRCYTTKQPNHAQNFDPDVIPNRVTGSTEYCDRDLLWFNQPTETINCIVLYLLVATEAFLFVRLGVIKMNHIQRTNYFDFGRRQACKSQRIEIRSCRYPSKAVAGARMLRVEARLNWDKTIFSSNFPNRCSPIVKTRII